MRTPLSPDVRRVLTAQSLRAFAYGFGAIMVGTTLRERHFSAVEVGGVLAAALVGMALASIAIGRYGDRLGRRRCYVALYVALAVTGVAFAFATPLYLLVVVVLSGALSTDVVESGPFTSLEQAMIATDLAGRSRLRGFGLYNAVAAASGALGALAAGLPPLVRSLWSGAPGDATWFLLFVPVALTGAVVAASLSPAVEAPQATSTSTSPPRGLVRSRRVVHGLGALFALDSLAGGFVVQAFVAYWLEVRFGASTTTLGVVFFAVAILQTLSFLVAPRLGERFGLLRTMVATHLPSNVLLALLAVAPNLGAAVAVLLARTTLSQMDVPTRQAYVMAMVDPEERTAAAAYTNTARYVTRPVGPALAGAVQSLALGAPFLIAGSLKIVYDLALWRRFSREPVPGEGRAPGDATPNRR
ncbi:MAG: MFS transporter [Acidimicrobiales bacterium]